MTDRLYHDHGNDDGLGYPTVSRHGTAEACAREPLVVVPRYRCAHCGAGITFQRFTFCLACLERLPDALRETLYTAYRYGQVDEPLPSTPKHRCPRPDWIGAYQEARARLMTEGR